MTSLQFVNCSWNIPNWVMLQVDLKRYLSRFLLVLLAMGVFISCAFYLAVFFPYLKRIDDILDKANQYKPETISQLYPLAIVAEGEAKIRSYAMRQAYRWVNANDKRQTNISWHWNNFVWVVASYLHFDNQQIFSIWLDCALLGCGKGIKEVSHQYYGKELDELSDRELAGIVLLVRSPKLYKPKSISLKEAINDLQKKVSNAK